MKKYVCSICGYVYDEEKGIPEAGIAQGTVWDKLPDTWVCPLCGAKKVEFKEFGVATPVQNNLPVTDIPTDKKKISALEMSILCSNLARGCEKQYMSEESAHFTQLATYFKAASSPATEPTFETLFSLIERDLEENFPAANAASSEASDRGALRALVWSEKVTRILKSLLSRYEKEGEAMFQNTEIYVCTICGFVYVGDNPPEICPVCKVPRWKFEKIVGR